MSESLNQPPKKARRRREWLDNDAFRRDLYPYLFSKKRFAEATGAVDEILKLARPRGRAKTLRFHHSICSGQELRERMEQAGFAGI